jgi:hypothetical protein
MPRKARTITSQITASTETQSLALIIELLRAMNSWDRQRVIASVNAWFANATV